MAETEAWCKECDWEDVFENAGQAEQACVSHHNETGHRDVWYTMPIDAGEVNHEPI